jgi:HNH endonuclease/NUMOD4 motif
MKEAWKKIANFEDYSVSTLGRIRRDTGYFAGRVGREYFVYGGKILKATSGPGTRYPIVVLRARAGRRKTIAVHKIVTENFLGKRPVGLQVNHKNGIKTDPRLCNLEYVTASENRRHAVAYGLVPRGERHHKCKLSDEQVRKIRKMGTDGFSVRFLAESEGVGHTQIRRILNNESRMESD